MSALLAGIARHAIERPRAPALTSGRVTLDYAALSRDVAAHARWLRQLDARCLALALDNSPAWAVLDLAALAAGRPVVPLADFFSLTQLGHALRDAGADVVITDAPASRAEVLAKQGWTCRVEETRLVAGRVCAALRLVRRPRTPALPGGTVKVTYTSGTTGRPKGVCLGEDALLAVAASLVQACRLCPDDTHLSLLPLPTLLENVAGVYAPLLAGACACLPPLAEAGLRGSSACDGSAMLDALARFRASTTILVPQLLQALLAEMERGRPTPAGLRFVAFGGAPVPTRLLARAAAVGLPVFQGYGMTECASVVALNTPDGDRPGSAGRPLPHVRVSVSPEGEILVEGNRALGYAGDPQPLPTPWPTGDLGHLDEDGFLHVTGRRRHVFITAFGRNVSPDWVESELTAHPAIAQAAVFGEGRPWNTAVIVARAPAQVEAALAAANAQLPDYARVAAWIPADAPFSAANRLATPNGRPRREAIWEAYRARIEQLYEESTHDELP